MEISTREIADKLFAYADFLDGERTRAHGMWRITNSDTHSDAFNALDREVEAVREMANALWDKKAVV